MFEHSAHLYDAIYDATGKDYAAEAAIVVAHVEARAPHAESLLDVACGTGRHLEHLRHRFRCAGVDLDDGLLAVARERCPDVPFRVADMVDFDLGERFDVVTCLFSAIGYARTDERLDAAIASMARHLAPGGVLLVEPWLDPAEWRPGTIGAVFVDQPELKVARINTPVDPDDGSAIEFHYLVGTPAGTEHFTERHDLGRFTRDDYRRAFESAGLTFDVNEKGLTGRGLLIGTVPAA